MVACTCWCRCVVVVRLLVLALLWCLMGFGCGSASGLVQLSALVLLSVFVRRLSLFGVAVAFETYRCEPRGIWLRVLPDSLVGRVCSG